MMRRAKLLSSGGLMIDVLHAAIRIVDPLEHSIGGREEPHEPVDCGVSIR